MAAATRVGAMRVPPARRIRGKLEPPPDKSISHRAALLAAMSDGSTHVRKFLHSEDTGATLRAVASLGARIELLSQDERATELRIEGAGLRGAYPGPETIDVGNAGTLLRVLPGWLAGQPAGRWTLDGDESIRRRPVDRVAAPLRSMGAKIECSDTRLPPLAIEGARLEGIRYELPVASAQVKSCLLLAGLLASGETTLVENRPTRDHTELMLAAAGAPLEVKRAAPARPATVTVREAESIALGEWTVPADFSSSAFFIVAATIVPGSELRLEGVGVNPTRTGLLNVMARMGAAPALENRRREGGEEVADVVVRHQPLAGTEVDGDDVPLTIDELPLVALLGAFANGTTRVKGAQELRLKESDRIATVVDGLEALGARIEPIENGFVVEGTGELEGGRLDAAGDHRLAMLGAVAGVASKLGVEVQGFEAAAVSYPAFLSDLKRVIK
jgi:3-phosphoshikimate 1-carboxyvinyltransferase